LVISVVPNGAVAQLAEHFHGMEGVRGSIPLSSTRSEHVFALPGEIFQVGESGGEL
jgi:hypothetical protein